MSNAGTVQAMYQGKSDAFPDNGHPWQRDAAGKVVTFDHVTDTARMIAMARAE